MTQTSWPFDGTDTTETQYSQLFRRLKNTGVWDDPNGTALKPYADSSGLFVKYPAGYALVRGHMYYSDAIVTVPVTVGSASARVDLLVLRLDPAANTILPVVLAGTSGSTTPPNPTQTDAGIWEMPLGPINVGASVSTITAGNVTDGRVFISHSWGMWTTATRPLVPRSGEPGWNLTTAKAEVWTGSVWQDLSVSAVTAAMISTPQQLLLSVGDSVKVAGHNVFVQAGTPASPLTNDLWFW